MSTTLYLCAIRVNTFSYLYVGATWVYGSPMLKTPSRAGIFLAPATRSKSSTTTLKPGQVRCPMCRKPFKATQDGFPRGHKHQGYECIGARYMEPQTPEPYPTEVSEESPAEELDSVAVGV